MSNFNLYILVLTNILLILGNLTTILYDMWYDISNHYVKYCTIILVNTVCWQENDRNCGQCYYQERM